MKEGADFTESYLDWKSYAVNMPVISFLPPEQFLMFVACSCSTERATLAYLLMILSAMIMLSREAKKMEIRIPS